MKKQQAMALCDFYKISHRNLYPTGTETIYSTFTARTSRLKNIDKVVSFGQQAFVKEYLIEYFNENFFKVPKEVIVKNYTRLIKYSLGDQNPHTKHIEDLHDLGYLPFEIKSIPEGISVPIRVPMFTIQNTDKRFFWVTNYIETLLSCEMWQAATSATIAKEYKKLLKKYADETSSMPDFIQFQAHDFSMRGMSSLHTSIKSGMAHLLSFNGTDTIPAISGLEEYYGADIEKELVGTSIPATEHSIQCAYANDKDYILKTITEKHPTGMVSVVSDGYDFWNVITNILPELKDTIMKRDGKLVIRPDSGDPVKIVSGWIDAPKGSPERKGLIECLWDIFGGTINSKGYKELDSHIGAIYGDSITLERAEAILNGLKEKGFASTNIVFGVGSYTYQYNTRDTFGFALKSTLAVINGVEHKIFKDPKTDDGTKKSQKGRVIVFKDPTGNICFQDDLSLNGTYNYDMLQTIFKDGKIYNETTLSEIRSRINE